MDFENPHLTAVNRFRGRRIIGLVLICVTLIGGHHWLKSVNMATLAQYETDLRAFQQHCPILTFAMAFLVYAIATGLSLPVALLLTIAYGWYFGLVYGAILVSFSSTTGAALAFLISRFLLRDAVLTRFGDRLKRLNNSLQREEIYCLFSLRLLPLIPFSFVNAAMGLTSMKFGTFWWVSQLGMLPATIVYTYAGSCLPSLQIFADQGIDAILTPHQLSLFFRAAVVLGAFPLIVRLAIRFRPTGTDSSDLVAFKSDRLTHEPPTF